MAFPATCTLTGSYSDSSGNPAQGQLTFTPSAELIAANQNIVLPAIPVTVNLISGAFSVNLLPTDTANVTPTGWSYYVIETIQYTNISVVISKYYIKPTGTGTVNIASLAQYAAAPTVIAYGSLAGNNTWTGSNTFNGAVTLTPPLPIASGGTGSATQTFLTLGGDLGGTVTAPTISKINGVTIGNSPTASGQVITTTSTTTATWQAASGGVSSVFTRTGAVVAASGDYSFSQISGTATIGQGGTGQTTQQAALDALAGSQTSAQYLRGNGTHVLMSAIQAGDVPTLNQSTTGSAASFTGSLAGDVTGTQSATTVGRIQGVAISSTIASIVANLNNAVTRSATATLAAGEETVFTGSTSGQTLTLPTTANAPTSSINIIVNTASVSVTLAPNASQTLNNFGTTGSITIPAGYAYSVVFIGTTWYVIGGAPSDFAKSNVLSIANGGTGATTQQAALNALAGAQTSAQYLRGNGTNVAMSAIQASDVPTLNQNTTGTAANVTGTVAIGNGGTGQTSANAGFNALSPMTALGDTVYGGTSGAGTRLAGNTTSSKNFLVQTGTGSVSAAPAWGTIAAGDVPTLNQNTTGTAANVTGTVAIGNGGTGQTSAAAGYNALSPMTTLGDIEYESGASTASRLAGNTTSTKNFLTQTGTGSVSAAPAWGTLAAGDIPANGNVQTFLNGGGTTWTKPANATMVTVVLVGGGGGGGSGAVEASGTVASGGAGGGGGGYTVKTFPASLLNATETVAVGGGGTGGTAVTATGNGNAGGAGGASTFKSSSFAIASGGSGGGAGTTGAATGGSGGNAGSNGAAGGASSATGGAGSTGAGAGLGASGGGGGGGIATTPASVAGGAGGVVTSSSGTVGGTAGTSGGGTGGAGNTAGANYPIAGTGGGGGGSLAAGTGGSGGVGGNYGGAGGGGAGATAGQTSGAGGNGAPGIAVVISTA